MKILYRIMDIMCHPSKIGMYFKDKAYVVLIHFLAFMAMLAGVLCLIVFHTDYITRTTADGIRNQIAVSQASTNVVYENYSMSGDPAKLAYNDTFIIYYNQAASDSLKQSNYYVIFYETDKVSAYLGTRKVFEKNYSELSASYSFTLSKVKSGEKDACVRFMDFTEETMDNLESSYRLESLLGGAETILSSFAIMFVITMIYTYMINPTIKFDVRLKLVIYDSLIFFFVYSFAFILNLEFLEYVAMLIPIWYAGITFRHIIRVNKNRK